MEPAIEITGVTHRYGRHVALRDLHLTVPQGALYALLGPNGAGKTTLLKVLTGLLRPTRGIAAVMGKEAGRLTRMERACVSYVAEGQQLPGWMTLVTLERYLEPLYPNWDFDLARRLRARLRIPGNSKLRAMSRGERMKAALLCALAPRPRVVIMDEPFTGMDALVKDELVQALLETAAEDACTVLVCSHDIGELEALADWVGFLDRGRLVLSEPMDVLRDRFRRVDVTMNGGPFVAPETLPPDWLGVERAGKRTTFLLSDHGSPEWEADVRRRFPGAAHVEVRPATLREVFVGLAKEGLGKDHAEEVDS